MSYPKYFTPQDDEQADATLMADAETAVTALRDEYGEIKDASIDTLLDLVEQLVNADIDLSSIKAGARHSASDSAILQQIYDAAEDICGLAEELGAVSEEEEIIEEAPGDMVEAKGIEFVNDELAVYAGDSVKAIELGRTEGYLVRFGGEGDLSEWRDVFQDETDYGSAQKSDVYVHHRLLPGLGKKRLANQAELKQDDVGIFISHLLNLRDPYEKALFGLAQKGKLGWSSGTAPHLVDREPTGRGSHVIKHWPLGLDASYTPTPAGGFDVNASAMKSLFADAGIDLLQAIYDSPEATNVDDERGDGLKIESERARRLLLELNILALETAL